MKNYLLVGAGLFNCVLAQKLSENSENRITIIESRDHIGGSCYDYEDELTEINVHKYGAHIFRTDSNEIWEYIGKFTNFIPFINSPIAKYHNGDVNEVYNLPFNMNTFYQMFKEDKPGNVRLIIKKEIEDYFNSKTDETINNLEDKAISLVGTTVYEKLIKYYTEKQWNHECKDLPPSIINRIPVRFSYDNNYFDDMYQGIPEYGYTDMMSRMINYTNIEVKCGIRFDMNYDISKYDTVIYTGRIDTLLNYKFGELEYRGLRFETSYIDFDDSQGVAVVNYTGPDEDYTRTIEHKFFNRFKTINSNKSVITKEYPVTSPNVEDSYYPVLTKKNNDLYKLYVNYLKEKEPKIILGGRLGMYKYVDMKDTIKNAISLFNDLKIK